MRIERIAYKKLRDQIWLKMLNTTLVNSDAINLFLCLFLFFSSFWSAGFDQQKQVRSLKCIDVN